MKPTEKYSYTKAIRFKLEPKIIRSDELKLSEFDKDKNPILELVNLGFDFLEKLRGQIYFRNKSGEEDLTKNIEIKKAWLKKYFNYKFYQEGHSKVNATLQGTSYVKDAFKKWLELWQKSFEELRDILAQEEHEKTRRADISYLITNLIKKTSFPFIEDFFKESIHKNEQLKWEELILLCDKIKISLKSCQIKYLPSKTSGLLLTGASMNYYTINKKPKEYVKILEDLKKNLKTKKDIYKYENGILSVKILKGRKELTEKFQFRKKERSWWNSHSNGNTTFSINEIYGLMKTFRAEMKSGLYEDINKNATIQEIENDYYLFSNQSSLREVFELTKEIEDEHQKRKRSQMRQKRGLHFIKYSPDKGRLDVLNYFREYYEFCESYKFIAMWRGKILAQIKGIEKEKVDSQNTKFWALIFTREVDGKPKRTLCLVPIDFRQKASDFLDNIKNDDSNSYGKIMRFYSLTKRALHKLCFAEESTFVKEMPKNLKQKQAKVKRATNDLNKLQKRIKRKDELELDFLKEIITSEYANQKLNLRHFKLEECQSSKSLEEFEKNLEKACYFKEEISFASQEQFEDFLNKCEVSLFDITSYDLEEHPKNEHQMPQSEYKRHTREIWNKFWQGDDTIRLNPEIRINYREKDEVLEEYLKSMENKREGFNLDDKFHHRKLQEQYTLKLTFELNAGKKYPQLAFAKPDEIKEKIKEFNEEFNSEREWTELWKYGIDRGNIELATLCLAKFKEGDTYTDNNGKAQPKPTFPNGEEDIKCYELLDKWYSKKAVSDIEKNTREKNNNPNPPSEKLPIDNISYFIDKVGDEGWFKSHKATCIDLTTAKVIGGKIILNGDVKTYLKLKKVAAKRFIYEFFNQNIILENSQIEWRDDIFEGVLVVETNQENTDKEKKIGLCNGEKIVYYFSSKHKNLLSKNKIKDGLDYYLEKLRCDKLKREDKKEKRLNAYSKHTPTIEQLNHLRDSIASNIVGILSFLQRKYLGVVVLEDLSKGQIDKQFYEHQENIARRLENKLYQKFQTSGLVPPHIKNIVELRKSDEKMKKLQLGVLFYVSERNTSSECPYCRTVWDFNKEEKNKMKFEEHRYVCGKSNPCGFDTKNISDKFKDFEDINDPDKVAAFNVAKRRVKKPKNK